MITMADIAIEARVSRSAVSHVLSDSQSTSVRISDITRQRILDTAAEMGYRPNQLARAVRSGKTRMIGYLIDEPGYEPYWKTLLGALAETEELGFTLKVLSVTDETLTERVHQCVELRLSGLIVRLIQDKSVIFNEANLARIPVVTVDQGFEQPYGASVAANDAPGLEAAIGHLIHLGHTRIGFISSGFIRVYGGKADIGNAREQLFRQTMQNHGLRVPEGYVTDEIMSAFAPAEGIENSEQSAIDAARALLSHPQGRPTAILCWRDETAMIAIGTCRAHGLRVPEDISVIGFSDVSAARFFDPPLTTVKSPWKDIGRVAVRQIAERISPEYYAQRTTHLVDTTVIVRKSTGPAPA